MRKSQLGLVGQLVCAGVRTRFPTHVLTVGTMAIVLFLFGVFMLVQENLQRLIQEWGDQIQINAYLDKNSVAEEVLRLRDRIQSFPEVERVRHVSREQAWKDFRAALGANSPVLAGLPEDVLPASFEIFVKPAYRDGPMVEALADRLRKEKALTSVEYPRELVDRLGLMILALQWVKWVLGGVLFFAIFFIVRSTVRLAVFAQKDEIQVMQLIGAPEEIIQAPVVVEGMIQGSIGAGLSVLGLWLLSLWLGDQGPASMAFLGDLGKVRFIHWSSVALIVTIGLLLGVSASTFSLRRLMKRWDG